MDAGHWVCHFDIELQDYSAFTYIVMFASGKRYIGAKKLWLRCSNAPKYNTSITYKQSNWKTYTTSSIVVNELMKYETYKMIIIRFHEDWSATEGSALQYENKLQTDNNVIKSCMWLNKAISGHTFSNEYTPEQLVIKNAKMAATRATWSPEQRAAIKEKSNASKQRRTREEKAETKRKLREANIGKKQSTATKLKRAATMRNKSDEETAIISQKKSDTMTSKPPKEKAESSRRKCVGHANRSKEAEDARVAKIQQKRNNKTPEEKAVTKAKTSGENNHQFKGWYQIDGVLYVTTTQAAAVFRCTDCTIMRRIRSDKFPNYIFIPKD